MPTTKQRFTVPSGVLCSVKSTMQPTWRTFKTTRAVERDGWIEGRYVYFEVEDWTMRIPVRSVVTTQGANG